MIHIYIYIYREREREREARDMFVSVEHDLLENHFMYKNTFLEASQLAAPVSWPVNQTARQVCQRCQWASALADDCSLCKLSALCTAHYDLIRFEVA